MRSCDERIKEVFAFVPLGPRWAHNIIDRRIHLMI